MAAHNWRALRQRCLAKGIGNPMMLSTMHTVLDDIEALGLEASTSSAKTTTEAKAAISRYHDRLYKPDVLTKKVDGDMEPPPGWSDEEVEASFDAFLNAGAR